MRFTSILVNGLFAAAVSAQTSETAVSTTETTETTALSTATEAASSPSVTVPSATVSIDPAQSSAASVIQQCLDACDPTDTSCRASCIAVPSPDNSNVNATTECVTQCPQGNGTAAENKAYGDCVQACIGQYYFTTSGTPQATSSGASGSAAASSHVTSVESTVTSGGSTFVTSVPTTVTGSGSSETGSAASSSSSDGAGVRYGPAGAGMGLLGLLLAL